MTGAVGTPYHFHSLVQFENGSTRALDLLRENRHTQLWVVARNAGSDGKVLHSKPTIRPYHGGGVHFYLALDRAVGVQIGRPPARGHVTCDIHGRCCAEVEQARGYYGARQQRGRQATVMMLPGLPSLHYAAIGNQFQHEIRRRPIGPDEG